MEQLPPELLLYIFQFASVSDTPIITRVCSLWRSVWQDQALWKYFHCRDLGCVVKPPLRSDQWRESYRVVVATIDRLKYWNSSAERIKRAATMDAGVWVLRELESYPLSKSLFAETIELGSFSTAFMLLKRYYKDSFRPHEVGDFIFRVGATSGNLTLITDLYEMGIYQRLRPFDSDVAMATDPESAKFLLEHGSTFEVNAFPNVVRNEKHDLALVKLLLTHPLTESCISSNPAVLSNALQEGLKWNPRPTFLPIFNLLIQHGAKIEDPLPLLAIYMDQDDWQPAVVNAVLDFLEKANYRFPEGERKGEPECLVRAAMHEQEGLALVKRIQGLGLNVNATRKRTALQAAAMLREIGAAKILLQCGADPNLTTTFTPYPPSFWATKHTLKDLTKLLEEHTKNKKETRKVDEDYPKQNGRKRGKPAAGPTKRKKAKTVPKCGGLKMQIRKLSKANKFEADIDLREVRGYLHDLGVNAPFPYNKKDCLYILADVLEEKLASNKKTQQNFSL